MKRNETERLWERTTKKKIESHLHEEIYLEICISIIRFRWFRWLRGVIANERLKSATFDWHLQKTKEKKIQIEMNVDYYF